MWAMSFAEWRCVHCRQVVRWVDAIVEDTPEIFCVRHKGCPK